MIHCKAYSAGYMEGSCMRLAAWHVDRLDIVTCLIETVLVHLKIT